MYFRDELVDRSILNHYHSKTIPNNAILTENLKVIILDSFRTLKGRCDGSAKLRFFPPVFLALLKYTKSLHILNVNILMSLNMCDIVISLTHTSKAISFAGSCRTEQLPVLQRAHQRLTCSQSFSTVCLSIQSARFFYLGRSALCSGHATIHFKLVDSPGPTSFVSSYIIKSSGLVILHTFLFNPHNYPARWVYR